MLQRLHRELTDAAGLRVVMASTRGIFQLHDICADWPTSPFLEGFDLSQTLGSLLPDQRFAGWYCRRKCRWRQRVTAAPDVLEAILEATNGHPYLVQVMCSRLFIQEDGTLRAPIARDFSVEPTLGFFNHDFNALTPSGMRCVVGRAVGPGHRRGGPGRGHCRTRR